MVEPPTVRWLVTETAHKSLSPIRADLGEAGYRLERRRFQEMLCFYFSTGTCIHPQSGITPIGRTKTGKILKVRWGLPGQGKRGGLRIVAIAYCEISEVRLVEVFLRKEDPSEADIERAVAGQP